MPTIELGPEATALTQMILRLERCEALCMWCQQIVTWKSLASLAVVPGSQPGQPVAITLCKDCETQAPPVSHWPSPVPSVLLN